jgi:hypothetical protein
MQRLLPCFGAPQALEEHDAANQALAGPGPPAVAPATTALQAWQHKQLTMGFSGGGEPQLNVPHRCL